MSYPSYAFHQPVIVPGQPVVIPAPVNPSVWRSAHFFTARGAYRIFGQAGYCFFYGSSPPTDDESEDEFYTSFNGYETSETFTDGIVYVAMKKTNGIVKSSFKPIGINGERYLRFDLSSGSELAAPPRKPFDVRLEAYAGGVIIVNGGYFEIGSNRGAQFAIIYTTNGSDPGEDSADITVDTPSSGPAILSKALPAQGDGTTVKVRVQMRRNDGTAESPVWRYSDTDSDDIMTATADAQGPAAPGDIDHKSGLITEET